MTQYAFFHDCDACIGCKGCVIACKDKNDLDLGQKFRRVVDFAGGSWEVDEDGICRQSGAFVYSVSFSCMHCENPACVTVCPTGAMQKDPETGVVFVDESKCIGCGSCAMACPYGAPFVDREKGYSRKCDMCRDLLAEGENPACVDACQMRCLKVGPLEELRAEHGDISAVSPLPTAEAAGTGPSVVFHPSRLVSDPMTAGVVTNEEEELITHLE